MSFIIYIAVFQFKPENVTVNLIIFHLTKHHRRYIVQQIKKRIHLYRTNLELWIQREKKSDVLQCSCKQMLHSLSHICIEDTRVLSAIYIFFEKAKYKKNLSRSFISIYELIASFRFKVLIYRYSNIL